jgi:predicted transcriptional regulator
LECLKALWQLSEASVKDVREKMGSAKPLAYTTVMTLLERLERKGAVRRRKVGRFFVYSPLLSREVVSRRAVGHLIDSLFQGSAEELADFLRQHGPSPAASHTASLEAPPANGSLDTELL